MTLVTLDPTGPSPVPAALAALGPAPSPEAVRALIVTDRSMGDGARLVAAGQLLAAALGAAWSRAHGGADPIDARHLIASRSLYGIAPARADVTAARRALTAWVRDRPVFVDHAIRRGDARWIFTPAQIAAFDPAPAAEPRPTLRRHLARHRAEHRAHRGALRGIAARHPTTAAAALTRADAALDVPRVIGDVLAGSLDDDRRPDPPERRRRCALVERWLDTADPGAEAELRALQAELRRRRATFHWQIEFSELYPHPTPPPAGRP